MKIKTIILLTVTLFISTSIFAQRIDKDKIKSLKIAHITEQLDLTEEEAQAFWPVYNANEEERSKLREGGARKLQKRKLDEMTEEEAQQHLEDITKMEEARAKLQREYTKKLKRVLSAKKILKLLEADRSFRNKMIKVFKERHRDSRQIKRKN